MSARPDPELDAIFEELGDLEGREFARWLHAAPHPAAAVEPDPRFRYELRRKLLQEAGRRSPAGPWYRRLLPSPMRLAASAALVGLLLLALAGIAVFSNRGGSQRVLVQSPLANSKLVALAQPITLTFSQPMDTASVEEAVSIQPATQVTYRWQGDTELLIVPKNQLAPNVRYQVTVKPGAKTMDGVSLAKPAVIAFWTAPTPPPTAAPPTVAPTQTPSGALSGLQRIGPVGQVPPVWSPDGSTVYVVGPEGQLTGYAISGGSQIIASSGVSLVAAGPQGPAYAANGQVVYGEEKLQVAQPLAIGFQAGNLEVATPQGVEAADASQLVSFSETAQDAQFSPDGEWVAYLGASGNLHLVDLRSGQDSQLGPASSLGAWSPDSSGYAYPDGSAIEVVSHGTAAQVATLAQVTGITWTSQGQLLLATPAGLDLMEADGNGLVAVAQGSFQTPVWAPSGQQFAFGRSGAVWIATLEATPSPSPSPPAGQSQVVSQFFSDLENGQVSEAQGLLGGQARQALQDLGQLVSGAMLRYYVVLSQPGTEVVRVVSGQGSSEIATDYTLSLVQSSGGWLIGGISARQLTDFGSGPEVLHVVVSQDQVRVSYDSDLNPSTVSGVTVQGTQVQASYDAATRTVILTIPGGLTAGQTYTLVVTGALQDVSGRSAVPYQLPFVGPSSGSGSPTPSPSPTD
jgi:hypothetical protein